MGLNGLRVILGTWYGLETLTEFENDSLPSQNRGLLIPVKPGTQISLNQDNLLYLVASNTLATQVPLYGVFTNNINPLLFYLLGSLGKIHICAAVPRSQLDAFLKDIQTAFGIASIWYVENWVFPESFNANHVFLHLMIFGRNPDTDISKYNALKEVWSTDNQHMILFVVD